MLWRPAGAVNAICMPWSTTSQRLRVESLTHSRTVTSGYRRYSHFVPQTDLHCRNFTMKVGSPPHLAAELSLMVLDWSTGGLMSEPLDRSPGAVKNFSP